MRLMAIALLMVMLMGCGMNQETSIRPTEQAVYREIKVEKKPVPTTTLVKVTSAVKPTTTKVVPTTTTTTTPTTTVKAPKFILSDYERMVVEHMVMGEAGGESYEGQVLVAQCILNAALKDGILPSEVRVEYQYSGWKENPTESVKEAVSAVFDDGYQITAEPILYFYAPKRCKSGWHETQRFITEVGGHRFFAEWED